MRLSFYAMTHPCPRCRRHHKIFVELSAQTFVCLACARVQAHRKDAPARERKSWRKRNLSRAERQRLFDERAMQIKAENDFGGKHE